MGVVVIEIILIPCAVLFTGIGIYAWRRKEPMWFWSGTTVSKEEIKDIPAYNRANGIMWIVFSLVLWISAAAAGYGMKEAGYILLVGCGLAVPLLPLAYHHIYEKYRRRQ